MKLLARVVKSLILRPIRALADGSYLAKVYRNDSDRRKDRDGIVVRVIRYTLDDPQRVGHGEEHVLITNLLDEAAHPATELIILYHERWEEELVFDEQKTHQDPRRATKPAQLRSETPAGVIQEVYALSLGHFVIRSLMFEAAATAGLDPDRLSFTGCFQILKCRLPECDSKTPATFEAWYRGVLWEMQRERTDPRRNRINPRVIKRKMSKWKKKRPEHRTPSACALAGDWDALRAAAWWKEFEPSPCGASDRGLMAHPGRAGPCRRSPASATSSRPFPPVPLERPTRPRFGRARSVRSHPK